MFEVNKNDKAFKELENYSKKVGKPLKEVLLSDEHIDTVSSIFYKHMPKMVRFVMKEPKFKEYYRTHREQLVGSVAGL